MIKIIIAGNNDSFFNNLKNKKIQLINIPANIDRIIESCTNNLPDMLILNFAKEELYKLKIIEKLYELNLNKYIIISATNLRTYLCFDKIYLLFDIIKNFEDFETSPLDNNYT